MRFVWGIADCSACGKWHPALLEEPEGAPPRIGGLQCSHCPGLDTCRLLRLGKEPTEERARHAITAWLLENDAA